MKAGTIAVGTALRVAIGMALDNVVMGIGIGIALAIALSYMSNT